METETKPTASPRKAVRDFIMYAVSAAALAAVMALVVVLMGLTGSDDYNGFDRCAYRDAMENCLKATRSDRDSTINNVFHCEQYARKYAMTAAETIKEGCYGERP